MAITGSNRLLKKLQNPPKSEEEELAQMKQDLLDMREEVKRAFAERTLNKK